MIMETSEAPDRSQRKLFGKTIAQREAGRIKAIETRLRHIKAMELRKKGMSYEAIKDELGYKDRGSVQQAVERMLHQMAAEPTRAVRQLTIARYDSIIVAIWQRVIDGDLAAIDRLLKVEEARARVIGFNAPVDINIHQMVKDVSAQLGLDADETAALMTDAEAFLQKARVEEE
jgi:hypothetical protein